MVKRMFMAMLVLTLSFWPALGAFSYAETKVVTDERFEKLAKELYPKAQQEGEVIMYCIFDVQHQNALLNAFSKQFPGIKTSYWQGDNPAIVARVLAELRAGQKSVDLIVTDGAAVLRAAGAIRPYETVQKDSLVLNDPTMPVVSLQVQALVYNTKQLKPADVPKGWEDLANPKYKGMVALDDPMRGGPMSNQMAALRDNWKNDTKWTNFVKGLKALNSPVHRSTSAMFRLVVSGEFAIAEPALFQDYLNEKEKGAPVDYVKSAPAVIYPRFAGIYLNSPHPNAAKLLAEWMVSPAGQAVYDSLGREVSRKDVPAKTSIEAAWPGIKPYAVSDKSYLEDPKKWLDTQLKPLWQAN